MSTRNYEVHATLPIQIGNGKIDKPKENTDATIEDPKTRNEKYGFISVKAEPTVTRAARGEDEGR